MNLHRHKNLYGLPTNVLDKNIPTGVQWTDFLTIKRIKPIGEGILKGVFCITALGGLSFDFDFYSIIYRTELIKMLS